MRIKLVKVRILPFLSKKIRVLDLRDSNSFRYRNALLISDIHCRNYCKPLKIILNLAERRKYDVVIILGDLLDDSHKPANKSTIVHLLSKTLGGEKLNIELIYVLSTASHDPLLPRPYLLSGEIAKKLVVSPYPVALRVDQFSLFLTHGEIIVKSGALAHIINLVLGKLGVELAIEKIMKRSLMACFADEWLIAAHTHIPGLDFEYKVGNTGNWRLMWQRKIRYWKPPTYSLIEISKKGIRLIRLNKGC
ncbi:MAG: hypothetical protein DRJ41_02560 [Thermoprotei archaeon]|nr:MAG: hypothetical protein DRJ41_02560 [Thermoprotei archaeon]